MRAAYQNDERVLAWPGPLGEGEIDTRRGKCNRATREPKRAPADTKMAL